MDLVKLVAPSGTEWEVLIAVVVVLVGPFVMERFRIPGLIGLLIGGMLIGPNVLGITDSHDGIVAELGELGLLYLMFMAGLDLDLNVFAKVRREAITFSLLTFTFPFVFGLAAGLAVGYEADAAVLLGSLLASYTLVSYPLIRGFGLAANKAVAVTVGATVITDTMALVVLAVVAGRATGSASAPELASQVVIGLAILCAVCFLVLPLVGRWYFASIGRGRVLRYTFAVAVLLTGATVASIVGIEPIVGAFFAGLALNRLVPNESEFMEHIEFFGSALLIPIFLVSVGTVIDPAKLVSPGTLGLAAVFTLACVGGKLIAAALCRPAFRFSWDEVGVVFSLSVAQAAATLAATFVGLEIGLLDTDAVNAIMLVIVVSLVVSSLTGSVFGKRVPRPVVDIGQLGRSVLVAVDRADDPLPGIASRIAGPDGGVVRPILVVAPGSEPPTESRHRAIEDAIAGLGIDAELDVRHDRSLEDGVAHAAASYGASLVVMRAGGALAALTGATNDLVRRLDVPVALVRPGTSSPRRVVLALATSQASAPRSATRAAVDLVSRLSRSGLLATVVTDGELDASLRADLATLPLESASPPGWLHTSAGPDDLVVIPGGRNGLLGSARAERRAVQRGATVVLIADREAIETTSEGFSLAAPLTTS